MKMTFEQAAVKFGPKIAKWLYGAYNAPALAAGASGGAAAAPAVSGALTATDVGLGAAGAPPAASGMPTTFAPWLSIAAPLIQTWAAYTAGSGRNDPMEKTYDIKASARLLKALLGGDAEQIKAAQAGVTPKAWKPTWDGSPSTEVDEGQPWSIKDLYHRMHMLGGGHKSPTTGNSAFSDADIDRGLAAGGVDMEKLGQELGFGDNAPDWTKDTYDTWAPRALTMDQPLRFELGGGDSYIPVYKEPGPRPLTPEEEELKKRGIVSMGAGTDNWI